MKSNNQTTGSGRPGYQDLKAALTEMRQRLEDLKEKRRARRQLQAGNERQ